MSVAVAGSIEGDEDAPRREDRPDSFADQLDDGVEIELPGERLADLVDDRQFRVAFARLLDRRARLSAEPMCWPTKASSPRSRPSIPVLVRVRLDDDHAEGPPVGDQRCADPVTLFLDRADRIDLARPLQVAERADVESEWLPGAEDVRGRTAGRAGSTPS